MLAIFNSKAIIVSPVNVLSVSQLERDSLIFVPGTLSNKKCKNITIIQGRMSNQHLWYINASVNVFMIYLLPGMVGKTSAEAKIWIYRNTTQLAVKDWFRLEKTVVMLYRIHHRNKNKKQILCLFFVISPNKLRVVHLKKKLSIPCGLLTSACHMFCWLLLVTWFVGFCDKQKYRSVQIFEQM